MSTKLMIYGAYGYTGKLMVKMAGDWDLKPVLAGRDEEKLKALAGDTGFEYRAFALDDRGKIADALKDTEVVLHSAGPFSATAIPMVEACLDSATHYLDITGEIGVFEALHGYDAIARKKGIMILPGVGFDVVPTDCLAAHVAGRLPGASKLVFALAGMGNPSRGTAKTAIENIHSGTSVRRDGQIMQLPNGSLRRRFDFGKGEEAAVAVSWGDVSTAYYSTGAKNVEVYFQATRQLNIMTTLGRYLGSLLQTSTVQGLLKTLINSGPEGPGSADLFSKRSTLLCFAEDDQGRIARAKLSTPSGYLLTCRSALTIAQKVLAGDFKAGFQTPSLAYGADLVLEIEGVVREDLEG